MHIKVGVRSGQVIGIDWRWRNEGILPNIEVHGRGRTFFEKGRQEPVKSFWVVRSPVKFNQNWSFQRKYYTQLIAFSLYGSEKSNLHKFHKISLVTAIQNIFQYHESHADFEDVNKLYLNIHKFSPINCHLQWASPYNSCHRTQTLPSGTKSSTHI